jgi:ribosome-binding protein aMBF1 (putative translation factor)
LQRINVKSVIIEENTMEKLRETINSYLEKTGMNQTELAHKIGISPSVISKLLGGNYKLTLETALKLSEGMNIDFISIVKLAYPDADVGDAVIPPDAEMIAREFAKLSPELQKAIMAIITTAK